MKLEEFDFDEFSFISGDDFNTAELNYYKRYNKKFCKDASSSNFCFYWIRNI